MAFYNTKLQIHYKICNFNVFIERKDEKLLNGDHPGSNGQEYRLTRVYPLIINES